MRSIIILYLGLLIPFLSFGKKQANDKVEILPGIGIVYNGDSIFLEKTTILELGKILNITTKEHRKNNEIDLPTFYDGVATDGKKIGWTEWNRDIKFKNINFQFASRTSRDSMTIKLITVKYAPEVNVTLWDSIKLGDFNPVISQLFPPIGINDFVSSNGETFNLYHYGLSYNLIINNGISQLVEISVHYKIKEK